MKRVYSFEKFDRSFGRFICTVYDGSRLVFGFFATICHNEVTDISCQRFAEGYSLLHELPLYRLRLCSFLDGTASISSLNTVSDSSTLFDL